MTVDLCTVCGCKGGGSVDADGRFVCEGCQIEARWEVDATQDDLGEDEYEDQEGDWDA